MDLLKLIKDKADYFSSSAESRGISSVVSHIEIAERHYEHGKSGDDYLFNDVVYRSNQAFEGAVKEAYRIIAGKNPNKITPHDIEIYFEENDVLKERVLQLFTNYRKEWRNKSTHDYTLYFSEQEAFLAIVNISAFINILLDQMVERQAYIEETNDLMKAPIVEPLELNKKPLNERLVELLLSFSVDIPEKYRGAARPNVTEAALIGYFTAFVNSVAKDIDVHPEYKITRKDGRNYMADLLLRKDEDKLVVEIKNTLSGVSRSIHGGTEQLLNYLTASGVSKGILYFPPTFSNEPMIVRDLETEIDGQLYVVTLIYPKARLKKTTKQVTKGIDD